MWLITDHSAEIVVCVCHYALIVVHARREEDIYSGSKMEYKVLTFQ